MTSGSRAPGRVYSFFFRARFRGFPGVVLAGVVAGILAQKFILWSGLLFLRCTGGSVVGLSFFSL